MCLHLMDHQSAMVTRELKINKSTHLRVLRDKGIRYRLQTVLWADENHRGASTHDQAQVPCVLGQFEGLFRIPQELCCIVQHEVQQWVISFQHSCCFPATDKLHSNGLLQVFAQIQDRLLTTSVLISLLRVLWLQMW